MTTLASAITTPDPAALEEWLDETPDRGDRERQLRELATPDRTRLVAALQPQLADRLLAVIEPRTAANLLTSASPATAAGLLAALDSDIAADILRELPESTAVALIGALPPARALVLNGLLSWPPDSAAAHMVPEALVISKDQDVDSALRQLREQTAAAPVDSLAAAYVYVVDDDRRLLGVVSLQHLVLAAPGTPVTDLTETDIITVTADTDEEVAARTLTDNRLAALPVIDENSTLLGVITADVAADIVEDETTEDAERQGGSEPLDVPYLDASPVRLWRKRVIWLLVLFIAEAYTGTVLRYFEDELDAVVSLAFFIPLLVGTGGNTGTQITTTLVRAASTGEVGLRDLRKVLPKELSAAVMISATMAAVGLVRAWTLGVGWPVMITVSISLAAIVLWSALVASILPLLLTKTRIDPAVVSAPMIATIVDGTGLLIYFMIAKAIIPELGQ
ncbi:magnesium transporter [Branchiibius cervicis]|uniref:Magnesium transporter MgtE n=1 Tax=Branchiibius cervicis TaxID=908252 RepID=A0ABW2AN42_9MICO